jgi:putative hydrolase of the HAD superfamily
MDFFYDYLTKNFGENTFEKMFDQSYLSYEFGYRKPDKEAFRYVLDNAGLNPSETVFIDDLSTNVEAASKLGIVAYQFHDERLVDLFERR